jgi:hypothetical protein
VVAVTVEHSDTGSGEAVDETDVGSGVTSSGRTEVVVTTSGRTEEAVMTSVEAEEVDKVSTGLGTVGLADNSEDDDVRTSLEVGTTTLDTAASVGSEGQMVNVRRRSVLVIGVTPGAHALVTGEIVLADEVDTEEDDVSVGRAEQDTSSIPSCKAMVTGTVPEEHIAATGEVDAEVEVAVMVGNGEQYVKGSGSLFGLKLTAGTEPEEHALIAEVVVVAGETATDDEDEDDADEVLADGEADRTDEGEGVVDRTGEGEGVVDRTGEGEGVVEVRTELLEALPQVPNPD